MNALTVKSSAVAAVGSTPIAAPTALPATSSAVEKNKQWQRELLMERIRSHASQQKTFPELSKSMRMSMLEKRYALDTVEKTNLQKCLDSMQHCIKVTSRQGLVERLESLSRQLGLKFMEDTAGLFISTDMFFLEIMLDANGSLTDVKVHHECKIEQQSCSELVSCLNRGDFADFTVQLEGLSSIYQLNAEPKVKKKAFVALQAMETDLYNMFQMQNFTKDTQQLLETSAVGLVLKRRGGHPMRLTYFVSPYDLISLTDKCLQPLSMDLITNKDIGLSVTVNLEAASANKLQILPTVTFAKDAVSGIETPVYAPLTQLNSILLPATFVLRLNKPLPVCSATLRALLPNAVVAAAAVAAGTGNNDAAGSTPATTTAGSTGSVLEQKSSPSIAARDTTSSNTIMNLIVQTASEQQLKSSAKGLFVCLPDQTHCYFFTDNKQLKATLITSVPFTEVAQVPIILAFLKKQALFYSLLSSCVRPQAKMGNDMDTTTILEANAISFQQISVSLQHPYEESMATVEFNLNDLSDVSCNIYASTRNYDLLSIKLTKIVQKSLSIPVTIRALLKFWEQERMQMYLRSIGGSGGSSGASAASTGGGGGNGGGSVGGGNVGNTGAGGGTLTQSTSAYGNFNLAMGPNDPGGGGGGGVAAVAMGGNTSGAVIKQEPCTSAAQRAAFMVNTVSSVNVSNTPPGIAGYLKLKTEPIKQEDFHESPKSATQTPNTINQMQSVEASSLGNNINTQQQQLQQQQTADLTKTSLATDMEIADKYKNIWKDKTATLKNSVSITPIMHTPSSLPLSPLDSNSGSTLNSGNFEMKRTGIEIIPLITQNNVAAVGQISSSSSGNVSSVGFDSCSKGVTNTTASGSSTITITPINSKSDKKSNSTAPATATVASSSPASSSSASSSSSSSKRNIVDSSGSSEQKEKKRSKKKRDDSPMGPPEKVFSRQNSPATIAGAPGVETVTRKFSSPSSSPKGGTSGSVAGIISAANVGSSNSSLSARPSPKHSPVYTSPKHHSTASNSPKSPFGTHSPKHGSSGKPSMSTLKSAAASLSPKADKTSNSLLSANVGSSVASAPNSVTSPLVRSLAGISGVAGVGAVNNAFASSVPAGTSSKNRDKEKNMANAAINASKLTNVSNVNLPPMKSPTSMNHMAAIGGTGGGGGVNSLVGAFNTIAGVVGGGSSNVIGATAIDSAMRKGAISAAVSLMTSTTVSAAATAAAAAIAAAAVTHQQHGNTDSSNSSSNSSANSSSSSSITSTNNEYRVKQSQEGLKLTINKTSNKSSSSMNSTAFVTTVSSSVTKSSSASAAAANLTNTVQSSQSKKQHTGLKPGVNSGPASSKKLSSAAVAQTAPLNKTKIASTSSSQQGTKSLFQKSYSSGNLSTKLAVSSGATTVRGSSNSSDSYRKSSRKSSDRDRERSSSSTSASQPATRLDHQADMLKILQYASPAMAANMEGFMKNLSTKFQIPKLSQRATAATCLSNANTTKATSAPTTPTLAPTATTFFNPPIAGAAGGVGVEGVSESTAANSKTTRNDAAIAEQQLEFNDTNKNVVLGGAKQHTQLPQLPLQQLQSTASLASEQQKLLITQQSNSVRPPPPPYHAAIAAASTTTNSTLNMRLPATLSTCSSTTSSSSSSSILASSSSNSLKCIKLDVEHNRAAADDALLLGAANTNTFDK